MNKQIDLMVKRGRGYWFVDGFTEMTAGGFFLLLAGILFNGTAAQDSFPAWFLSIAGKILIAKVFGALIAVLILWWTKDHFTYPRTGYARGNRITAAQASIVIRNAVLFLLLPMFGLLAISMLATSEGSVLATMPIWFPIGVGFIWTVLYVPAGEWLGLRRFRLLGSATLLAGIVVGFWQLTMKLPAFPANTQPGILQPFVLGSINRTLYSLGFLVALSGIILLFSGIVTFLRYRKENPLPYAEEA